ncbi:MAG TPA: hypothetical protein VG476_06120 [Acidimicrobiales bacterium]|nr:hypothetical protein [Acidimicrobiales bacterium]
MLFDIVAAIVVTIAAILLGLTVHPVLFFLLALLALVAWHAFTGRRHHTHV